MEQIKQIIEETVNATIKQFMRDNLMDDPKDAVYNSISETLFAFFKNGEKDKRLCKALDDLRNDDYIEIITLYYRDNCTIEEIAEIMEVDVSTIVRNKKRICISIYLIITDCEK